MPVCQQSARTFCSAFHDGHGVLHHVSGATIAIDVTAVLALACALRPGVGHI